MTKRIDSELGERFSHTKRKKALEAALQRGELWGIVKAQFALDFESIFDGVIRQIITPDSAFNGSPPGQNGRS